MCNLYPVSRPPGQPPHWAAEQETSPYFPPVSNSLDTGDRDQETDKVSCHWSADPSHSLSLVQSHGSIVPA